MSESSFKCKYCGAPISRAAAQKSQRCRACWLKQRSAQTREKWEILNTEHPHLCVCCGKEIQWNTSRANQNVQTCSRRCAALLFHRHKKETADSLEARLVSYIKSQDHYVPMRELRKVFRISDKLVYSRGLSVPQLNKKAGKDVGIMEATLTKEEIEKGLFDIFSVHRKMRLEDAAKRLHIPYSRVLELGVTKKKIYSEYGLSNPRHRGKAEIERRILEWLRTQPVYRCAQDICRELHIDYKCTIQGNGIDIVGLNRMAGHEKPACSYYEELAYIKLKELGIQVSRQKTFPGLASEKGWKLRYDFWIPAANTLIEVDGEQHTKQSSVWYSTSLVERDNAKNAYAKRNGISMIRLSTTPASTYVERLNDVISHVKGALRATATDADSTELLEASAGNAGGDQQPSLE